MKKETLRCLVLLVLVGFLTIGLYARISEAKCHDPKVIEGYIECFGGRTWYRIVGADKPGIPMILLHGGPGVNSWYMEPMEPLADERPVIYYDQRGGGYSDPLPPKSWNVEFFVEELRQLIVQLGLEKFYIFGHSWGTMLGTDYFLNYPEGVVGIIFCGSAMSTPLWIADQRSYLKELPEELQEAVYQAEASGNYNTPEYQEAMSVYYNLHLCRLDPWPEILVRSLDAENVDIYQAMVGISEFTQTGSLQDYDRTPDLYKINVPTLLLCGKYDEATPKTTAYYASLIPGSKMKVFNKSSHTPMLEQSQQFNKEIRNFLRKVERKERD